MSGAILAAWRFRHFIISAIVNDFKSRFIRSRLGALWMLLQPLAQVAIFAVILSRVLSAKMGGIDNPHGYALYLMAGTLAWSLFSDVILRCLTIFIDNGHLMKKIVFPKICLVFIGVGTALVNNALLFVSILLIYVIFDHVPDATILYLPVIMAIGLLFALGLGLILGILNVFIRDIGQAVPIVIQILFWFTPIVYFAKVIPETYRHWLVLNPAYHIVTAYQDVLVFRQAPDWIGLGAVAVLAVALAALAVTLYRRAQAEMVDVL